jgi:hypothetical protein
MISLLCRYSGEAEVCLKPICNIGARREWVGVPKSVEKSVRMPQIDDEKKFKCSNAKNTYE